jgi:F-type H+-transporting ATPase subunit alpha
MSNQIGVSSLITLLVIETQVGKVYIYIAYIPTNVISIINGQIFLETLFFYRGIQFTLNIRLSINCVNGVRST